MRQHQQTMRYNILIINRYNNYRYKYKQIQYIRYNNRLEIIIFRYNNRYNNFVVNYKSN